jgi:hypothetical protein
LSHKTSFCFNSKEEHLLHDIYLEETLDQLLQTLYVEAAEISIKVQQLEALTAQYLTQF